MKLHEQYKQMIETPLFAKGPIVMFLWKNEEGWPVEAVSKNIEAVFGNSVNEYLEGKLIYSEQIHPDDLAHVMQEVTDLSQSKTESFSHDPYRICDKSGNYRWVNDTTMILRDERGEISHYIGYVNDITNTKNLENALVLERVIFDNIDYICIVTEIDGTIKQFNKKGEERLGYKREELIGKFNPGVFHIGSEVVARAELFSEELGINLEPGFEVFIAKTDRGMSNEHEWTYATKSGDTFPVSLSVTALRDNNGTITGYIGLAKDITEFKESQKALLEAKSNAEKANRSKSQFLANMSHEIRTPLNAIMGFINLLKKDETDTKKNEYLSVIQNSSVSLLSVINDILDISKIEEGKFEIECVDFNIKDQCSEVVTFFQATADIKNVTINVNYASNLPSYVNSDPLRIKQIISNLLSNAIKFSKENSTILVDINYTHEYLKIIIKDGGIGITDEAQKRIFNPFEQAETSTARKFGGTGLGLSISKRLAQLLGGDITLQSTVGVGTTFTVTLKVSAITKEQENMSEDENVDCNFEGHVLVAEDNKTNQMLIKIILDEMNITCDIANDGVEAVEKCLSNSYDLILMDINMPNMDGVEATQFIREKSGKGGEVPIIALTANAMKEQVDDYLNSGMNAHVSKPINVSKLTQAMKPFLKCSNIK